MDTLIDYQRLPFILHRAEIAQGGVVAAIRKPFHVCEDGTLGLLSHLKPPPMNLFGFQDRKEVLSGGIVSTVPFMTFPLPKTTPSAKKLDCAVMGRMEEAYDAETVYGGPEFSGTALDVCVASIGGLVTSFNRASQFKMPLLRVSTAGFRMNV